MATKKISELEAISEVASDDVLAIVDVSETETKKITKGNLLIGAGHTIEMSLNSTTYVLTLTLKNEAGTALSTATIDLPSEDAITGITYSDGALTLTKQSGVTSSVSISGLISGLVDETTFNNFVTSIKATIGISTNTYNSSSTYNTGDIVVQNEKIYKCKQDNVTGTFDNTKWDEISLYEYQKLQDQKIENKVEKENGKGLSTNDYTTAEKNKLSGIETGAEVNIIETVKVNGTALTPTDKEVNVPVPTKTSDLTNDSGFGTYTKPSGGIPKADLASSVQTSLGKADSALQEHQDISGKEDSSNKVTDVTLSSTDTEYPSAKAVYTIFRAGYDYIQQVEEKFEEQQKILSQMPKVIGEGTEFTMENTIEAEFAEFLPGGNTVQNGEPTVDNPVERYSAGENGSITEKIINKNLHDATTDVQDKRLASDGTFVNDSGYATSDYIPVVPLNDYVYNRYANGGGSAAIVYYKKDKTAISRTMPIAATSVSYKTITTPENAYYVKVCDSKTVMPNVQFEKGTEATPYTEHKEQTYTIPVQQEMRSIGIVRDEFIVKNDTWYERHNIARVIFDGTENWTVEQSAGMKRFNLTISDLYYYNGRGEYAKSNYFHSTTESEYGAIITYQSRIMIYVSENITTVEQFKAWIAEKYANNNPLYVDYIVAEPTDLPCTQAQIDVLEDLPETYAEQTNVLSEDTVPANVKASGLLDLNTLLNAIVALGGVI